jgi:hypothetical protein
MKLNLTSTKNHKNVVFFEYKLILLFIFFFQETTVIFIYIGLKSLFFIVNINN